jgi:hypothetical protein
MDICPECNEVTDEIALTTVLVERVQEEDGSFESTGRNREDGDLYVAVGTFCIHCYSEWYSPQGEDLFLAVVRLQAQHKQTTPEKKGELT